MKTVGVLALQGDFDAHTRALTRAGATPKLVRAAADLDGLDGLVIPGGESTTMLKLLKEENMVEPVRQFAQSKPVFGTCAGAILMANAVTGPTQESLGLLDMSVERNAYGRQVHSRIARVVTGHDFAAQTGPGEVEAVFIRAPIIRRIAPDARVLAEYEGNPVLVDQGRHLVSTFHPELTGDTRVHQFFLGKM